MERSILQHARDGATRRVTVDEVAELIRGDQWLAGYRPLMLVLGVFKGFYTLFLSGFEYYFTDQEIGSTTATAASALPTCSRREKKNSSRVRT